MSDKARRYLMKKGINNIEVVAENLPEPGKDRMELSTLLDMYAEKEMTKEELMQIQGEYRIILMKAGVSQDKALDISGEFVQVLIDKYLEEK